jgi:hypothetical protein
MYSKHSLEMFSELMPPPQTMAALFVKAPTIPCLFPLSGFDGSVIMSLTEQLKKKILSYISRESAKVL